MRDLSPAIVLQPTQASLIRVGAKAAAVIYAMDSGSLAFVRPLRKREGRWLESGLSCGSDESRLVSWVCRIGERFRIFTTSRERLHRGICFVFRFFRVRGFHALLRLPSNLISPAVCVNGVCWERSMLRVRERTILRPARDQLS
jgi:hypothetical protein